MAWPAAAAEAAGFPAALATAEAAALAGLALAEAGAALAGLAAALDGAGGALAGALPPQAANSRADVTMNADRRWAVISPSLSDW